MSESNDVNEHELAEQAAMAQVELKRAYLHVSFGQYAHAIDACERAAGLAPQHYLPTTLKGSFEIAAGRVRDALGTLKAATRRFPKQALPEIYFAEACFLAGRRRQAERALEKARKLCATAGSTATDEDDGSLVRLIDELVQTWKTVDPAEVPPPLVVEASNEVGT